MERVCIYIENEQRGFLISLGIVLRTKYGIKITFIIKDENLRKIINQDKNSDFTIKNYNEIKLKDFDKIDIINESKRIESKYNININMLISENRAIGQGYLFNTLKTPFNKKSKIPLHKKYLNIITDIIKNENIINNFDLIIQFYPSKLKTIVAKKNNIKILSIAPTRHGDYHLWSDDDYLNNIFLKKSILKNLSNYNNKIDANISFHPWVYSANRLDYFSNIKLKKILINIFKILIFDLKRFIRNNYDKNSYKLFGWVMPEIRRYTNFKYVKSISLPMNQIKKKKFIYFPLHLEPEIALLWLSPEFNNSMEAITWLSKNVPADVSIIVKEQGQSFSVRSKSFYSQLDKIGNVYFADPLIQSLDLIEECNAVATFTGTAGFEAVYKKKPVISFGMHQIINYLPTVFYSSSFFDTAKAIHCIFNTNDLTKSQFSKSLYALNSAQVENSFELLDYKNSYKSDKINIEMAEIALKNLFIYLDKHKT